MSTDIPAFILHAIDDDLLYPWLATRFQTAELSKLKCVLSIDEAHDPSMDGRYLLSPHESAALCDAFNLKFDYGHRDVLLFRDRERLPRPPYLIHTGYELPLLLEGRKKLAFMDFDSHCDELQMLKARFDHYVAVGLLHEEEEICDVTDMPNRRITRVYYTPKGEEWRIPALKLIMSSSGPAGGWSVVHERLQGTLMGYEDWQNDWWLESNARGDGVLYGMSLRCAVTKAGFEWVIHSGNRTLPPVDSPSLTVHSTHTLSDDAMQCALRENPDIEAFVQFNIGGRHLMHVIDIKQEGPYEIPASTVPEINRKLTRPIHIVAQR